jgi:general stress protein 26
LKQLDLTLKSLIQNYNAGSVASVNDNGTPAVSPKATFVVVDDSTIAFGNIRSPKTIHNFQQRPQTEINFIDVLTRRAARVAGTVRIAQRDSEEWHQLLPTFIESWQPYLDMMDSFVIIDIIEASLVTSPAYDIGIGSEELMKTNLEKLNALNTN